MPDHKITIIVPVYNVEEYVGRCLESIITQTHANLEIIVVNDGSDDNSMDVVEKFSTIDNRFVVVNQKNLGLSLARNCGLDIATGDYVLFVDSDDWLDPEACERLLDVALETNADVVVFGLMLVAPNWVIERKQFKFESSLSGEEYLLAAMQSDGFTPTACNKFYKKDVVSGVRFPPGLRYEDIYFTAAVLASSATVFIEGGVFYYYQKFREHSITSLVGVENYNDLKMIYYELEKYLRHNGKSKVSENVYFKLDKFERFNKEIVFKLLDGTRITDKNNFINEIKNDKTYCEMSKFYKEHGRSFLHKCVSGLFLAKPKLLIIFKILFKAKDYFRRV